MPSALFSHSDCSADLLLSTFTQLPNITQAVLYLGVTVSMSGNQIDEQLFLVRIELEARLARIVEARSARVVKRSLTRLRGDRPGARFGVYVLLAIPR